MTTHLIARPVLQRAAAIRGEFIGAKPFKHACIEDFLEPRWAETLLAEFPVFDPGKAINEFGKVGRKAVRTDLREISPRYREFYDYISSPAFLEAMSEMTGIPGLQFDQRMYGGGTHENLEGQALDPHVDFNYDQDRQLHRRINLLIYLNKEWDVSWGGAIQLHSDPRDWEHDQVETFNCNFNRCVVFETNEHSWHGFRQIRLPADRHGLTRKCISIYLYTRERPAQEIVPVHGTFYVQRPLPEKFAAGRIPDAQDVAEFQQLVAERDEWIGFYQRLEKELATDNRSLSAYAGSLAWHSRMDGLVIGLRLDPLRGLANGLVSRLLRHRRGGQHRPSMAPPPPPPAVPAGQALDGALLDALRTALKRRDEIIHRYQRLELKLRGENDRVHARIASLLAGTPLPLRGGLGRQPAGAQGAYSGGWVSSRLQLKLRARRALRALRLEGTLRDAYPAGTRVEARIDGVLAGQGSPQAGKPFVLMIEPAATLSGTFSLEIATTSPQPVPPPPGDERDLAFTLQEIRGLR